MTFAHPYFLLLLPLLPLLAWLKGRRGQPPAFLYSAVRLVEGLTRTRRSRAGAFLAALRWLALALFIVALAQPRLMKSATTVKASGIDIVCALDLSGSMISEDFVVHGQRVNRVNMAKSVLKDFIDKRPNDRIGLVVFAAQAFIAAPLTLDHDYLQENLDRLEIGTINSDATAIGDALTTSINRLRDLKAKSKIIILATDGQNNSGKIQPLLAADAAAALGIKIYTVGIGEQGTAPMPVFMGGQKVGYQNVPVDVDEDTLQKIADKTGGKYYRADNAERFRQIYAEIDKLEKTEAIINKFAQFDELFPWLCRGGWRFCWLKLFSVRPFYGGCREIADLRFAIYDLKMRFEHPQILWLCWFCRRPWLAFFWWAMRSRQRLLVQFIEARLLTQLTVGISPARQKIRFGCLVMAVALAGFTLAGAAWI